MDAPLTNQESVRFNKPKSIVETVAEYLRDAIVAGELKPGQKISTNGISKQLGVSSIPVREAFRILEMEGLIFRKRGRGSWVSEASQKDLQEAFEMRMYLELYAVDLLKRRVEKNSKVRDKLKEIDIREQAASLGPESCLIFHHRLVELADNKRLLDLYNVTLTYTRRYQRMAYTIRHGGDCCVEPHSAILNPLIEGNYEQAKRAIRAHLQDGMKKIEENVELSE